MAYYCIDVQKPLHSILDTLTKTAVAEIAKLIEDGYAVLRLEISNSQKENETLKMKLQEMERELETTRENGRKREMEFKEAFATRYCLSAEEEDIRRCVVVEQGSELLSESLIKKERLEDQKGLGGDRTGHISTEIQPSRIAAPEQLSWAEPEMTQGDSEDAYADFCYATEGEAFPVSEGEAFPVSEGEGSLKRHLQSHVQRRAVSCTQCPKSFPDQLNLSLHQRHHKRDRQFSCATCGKGFFRKHHLKSHLRTHTGERPYCCKYCGKDYKQVNNLISHQRSHTGERPYSCTECGKCFHRLDILRIHQRIHTRERKFVCTFADCQESFDQKYLFESHQLSHTI